MVMSHIILFEQFVNEEWEGQWNRFGRFGHKKYHWKTDYEDKKRYNLPKEKEDWKVIVVTEESLARFIKRHKREPISKKSAGYHFNCTSKKDAEKLRNRLEEKGTYEGQKIIALYIQEENQNTEY
jgi:hypothetical protein